MRIAKMSTMELSRRIKANRKITGMSAILLPFQLDGEADWHGFRNHVRRTSEAGLIPAINMDTGYGPMLDQATRNRALALAQEVMGGKPFVAGAIVSDARGDEFRIHSYARQLDEIQTHGAIPIVFQSYGLAHQADDDIVANYQAITKYCDQFLAFELGTMFADFGAIYSIAVYRELLNLKSCVGAKHSSLSRQLEWERLAVRDEIRPEFMVLTGNDLAIDMVMYGSDYLLGLSTFCPDLFAKRDQLWELGDLAFYQLNDRLQYLGAFAFRNPTSAYKHSAAMFLNQRGWIETDLTHPKCEKRPASDRAVLYETGVSLGIDMSP